jgi:adenylate kinase
MRIVLLGPPGAGKGTQAERLAVTFGLPHVATGEIFRSNVAGSTPLGRTAKDYLDSGELVPDEIVIDMVLERIADPDCAGGFVLDGFPRSVPQARALDRRLGELGSPLDAALNLDVPEDELYRRLAGRARADDTEQTIRNRLHVFASTTAPLLDYYEAHGLLFSIPATGTVEQVNTRLLATPGELAKRVPAPVGKVKPSLRIVLLGPPGAGKGTQAARLAATLGLAHVATGEVVRAHMSDGSALGQIAKDYADSGELVPDEIVIDMVLDRLTQPDCANGFVLDGFPHSIAQARALDRRLGELGNPLDAAVGLEVSEDELYRRLASRARPEDSEEIVRKRLHVLAGATRPLLDYYDEREILFTVPAAGTVDEVADRLLATPAEVSRRAAAHPTRQPPTAMRVVLLGAPGAGKGTQAERLASAFGLAHVATGEVFRANVDDATPLGRIANDYLESGELVPDEVVIDMVMDRLAQPDCAHGFVLDGFPRNIAQARALDRRLGELGNPLDAAVGLEVSDEELYRRLAARARPEDTEDTIRTRVHIFASTTRPLLDYYDEHGILLSVPAGGTVEEVTRRVLAASGEVARLTRR